MISIFSKLILCADSFLSGSGNLIVNFNIVNKVIPGIGNYNL
jgi:hypothetical protein